MSHFTSVIALFLTGTLVSALPSIADKHIGNDEVAMSARQAASPAAKGAVPTIEEARLALAAQEGQAAREAQEARDAQAAREAREAERAFATVLGTYRTRYQRSGRSRGRAHNVERATEILDGAVIAPGERLSFNDRVGRRDRQNGFTEAPVIDGGRIVPGMGGGVCQVASTLHAAALLGGLEMTQYRPHSRPSSYIPMGLDATVSFPQIDFEIENPFDFPVEVHARTEGGRVFVELVGRADPREVEVSRQVLNRRAYETHIVEDASLAPGTRVVEQRGVRGARIARTRTFVEAGETHVQRQVVRYPPTDEVVRVGVGPALQG
ncbi:MAG: VanW family protein [Deltaproteobacteria bacterium]|nr:VanW family protein [Deltaproteobacteria bacterium]